MSNTPSKAEIEVLVKRHGATSYRNRADTQHPAYGFTEDGLNGLIDEALAKWGTPAQAPTSAPMSPTNRLVAYSAATRLRELGFEWDATAEAWLQPAQPAAPQPAPSAQADSVQEDAARYRFIRDVPYSDDVRSVLVHQQNAAMDRVIDAARKQGASHDR